MTSSSARSQSAAVSRTLRAAGFQPLPSGTPDRCQGIRVRASVLGQTSVTLDYDVATPSRTRMMSEVRDALTAAGYDIEQADATEEIPYPRLYVAKSAQSA